MTSGAAAATARATARGSSASASTGVAPSCVTITPLVGLRVMPVTSWPRATSWGTSCLPMAPVAPATRILMMSPRVGVHPLRRGAGAVRDTRWAGDGPTGPAAMA